MVKEIILTLLCGFAGVGIFFLGCQILGVTSNIIIWGGAFGGGISFIPILSRE